jgi:hypothetical protein
MLMMRTSMRRWKSKPPGRWHYPRQLPCCMRFCFAVQAYRAPRSSKLGDKIRQDISCQFLLLWNITLSFREAPTGSKTGLKKASFVAQLRICVLTFMGQAYTRIASWVLNSEECWVFWTLSSNKSRPSPTRNPCECTYEYI